MKLYTKAGYLNVEGLLRQSFTFNFLIGGRGTGKTFGALQYIRNNRMKVFFIRRQQTQIDIISKPEFNPFKAVDSSIASLAMLIASCVSVPSVRISKSGTSTNILSSTFVNITGYTLFILQQSPSS